MNPDQEQKLRELRVQLAIEKKRYTVAINNEFKKGMVSPLANRIADRITELERQISSFDTPIPHPKAHPKAQSKKKRPGQTKLKPDIVKAIKARRREGASYAKLEEEFGLSHGSVITAVRMVDSVSSDESDENEVEDDDSSAADESGDTIDDVIGDAATESEQRAMLSQLARQLTADIQAARASGDPEKALRLTRMAAVVFTTLRRLNRPQDEEDVVKVSEKDIATAAQKFRQKMHELLDKRLGR